MTEAEQLRASRGQLSAIQAALDEHAIVAIADSQGKLVHVNDNFCAISEYSRAELIGQDHRITNSGHHPDAFMRDLWTTISHGRIWRGEIRNRSKSGADYWVATTIAPSLNERAKPSQYVSIRTDITARKRAEEEFHKLSVELERRVAERTADLEAFSYSASHDLRGPLHVIGGYTQAIIDDFAPILPHEGCRRLEAIQSAATRMGALIKDLLTFAQANREGMRMESIDTAGLVAAVWAELDRSTTARTSELHLGSLPACSGAPSLLKQVWVNLLSNALKYTAKRDKAIIAVGYTSIGGVDAFFVRDNGTGFDMREAGRLFAPFERLHRSDDYAGTGVGLAIVHRIVRRHGGRVWAEAAVDRGATFYFTLGT